MVTKGTPVAEHTLFLGLSILGFTAGVGWGEQSSQVVIRLVEDDLPSTTGKIYYDSNLEEQIWYDPDPGFTEPTVGAPVMFRFGNFEFDGIIQSWKKMNDTSGNPIYEVTLTDPREILAGTQLIIGGYNGPILNSVANVLNVFGFWESYGSPCPEAYPGGFGGSLANETGMPWNHILTATLALTSTVPKLFNVYSPYGRLIFRNEANSGYGVLSGSEYLVDLTEVPGAPIFYRIGGEAISLLDAISQVCQDGGCDYYVELQFVRYKGSILKIIKIKTASRRFQPTLGHIQQFIDEVVEVNASDIGRELRNEVNSAVLIGGDIELIHEAEDNGLLNANATIWPYWGVDVFKRPIIGIGLGNDHQFTINIEYLGIPEIGTEYTITVLELRAMLAGEDEWETYLSFAKPSIAQVLKISSVWNAQKLVTAVNRGVDEAFPSDFKDSRSGPIQNLSDRKDDEILLHKVNALASLVKTYATEFYGKRFLVRLPFVCAKKDIESGEITYSVEVNDSGWIDDTVGVIGLDNQSLLDIFRDDQGKLTAFVRFTNADQIDVSKINPDNIAYEQNEIFVKCTVDERILFDNPNIFTGPRAVITLESVLSAKPSTGDRPAIYEFLVHVANADNITDLTDAEWQILLNNLGEIDGQAGLGPLPYRPVAAALPFRSNIGSYGPWFVSGATGKVQFEKDESLVPWNFGGTTLMSSAGNSKVSQMLTFMQESELGSVTVPGIPELALGAELRSAVTNLFDTRISAELFLTFFLTTITVVYIPGTRWTGAFGPNVSNMDVSVGTDGVTTTYRMQTFTPKFLGIFAKNHSELLKTLGQRYQRTRRTIRALRRPKPPREIGSSLEKDFFGGIDGRYGIGGSRSAHNILLGQTINFNLGTEQRTHVQSQNIEESKTELGRNYINKSWMSYDGLLRPFSTKVGNTNPVGFSGSGNNPPCMLRNTSYAVPPFEDQTDLQATYKNLSPFLNPGAGLLNNTNTGHDIEYIVHGTGLINDVHIRLSENYDTAGSGYRGIGLRGPLILTGWGLDTEGKPVPNATPNNPSDKFEDEWLKKSNDWKTGPVDLRWDEGRGVWTSWPGFKLLQIEFDDTLNAHSTAAATVLDDVAQYGATGEALAKTITVTGVLDGQTASVGDQAFAYYDSKTCKYWALLGGGGANVIEGLLLDGMNAGDLCNGSNATLNVYSPAGTGCIDFVSDCRGDAISGTFGLVTTETIVNRDVTLTAANNAYCIAIFMNNEYRPIYVGCPPCPTSGCVDALVQRKLTGNSNITFVGLGNLTVTAPPTG